METLEARLRRELERLSPPGDPAGVVDRVLRQGARRHARRGAGIVLLALSVIAGSLGGFYALSRVFAGTEPANVATTAVSNGLIVFEEVAVTPEVGHEVGQHLFLVDPRGGGPRQLTRGRVIDQWPAWSPDGTRIAFARENLDERTIRLAVLNLSTGEISFLTPPDISVARPDWSPDGERIAFSGFGEGIESGIYVVGVDGSALRRITDDRFFAPDNAEWSPDGSTIAFSGNLDETKFGWDVYLMDSDGSNVHNVTNTIEEESSEILIGWLDASSLLINRGPGTVGGTDQPQEYVWLEVSLEGEVLQEVFHGTYRQPGEHLQSPSLSPDGRYVVFDMSGDPPGIWYMDLQTGERTQVTTKNGFSAAWQPIPEVEQLSTLPSPTESPPADEIVDLGLGFPVCNVTSVTGEFVTPMEQGVAYVATKAPDVGGCPLGEEGPFQVVALDLNGDQRAEASYGPLECIVGCSALAAPDVNRDGVAEIAVATGRADGKSAMLFRTVASDGSVTIEPIDLAPPGDPEHGFALGRVLFVVSGGGLSNTGGAYCLNGDDAAQRLFVIWHATVRDPLTNAWDVTSGAFVLVDGELVLDRVEIYRVPEDEPELPSRIDSDLCGAPIV